MSLSVCLSTHRSVHPSTHPSVCLSNCLSVYLYVCPSVCLSNLSLCLSARLSLQSLFLPVSLSVISLFLCLSARPSVTTTICPSVCPPFCDTVGWKKEDHSYSRGRLTELKKHNLLQIQNWFLITAYVKIIHVLNSGFWSDISINEANLVFSNSNLKNTLK